jgi:XisI protein
MPAKDIFHTEDGIAEELIAAGIPKQHIVLGFHEPEIRPHTGFAVARSLEHHKK